MTDKEEPESVVPFVNHNPHLRIVIWPWEDAPPEWKAIAHCCGDEDWLAFIPRGLDLPEFMREGSAFGCCTVDIHNLGNGDHIATGCHS